MESFEFPSLDALKKYLKIHPNADKSNHSVAKPHAEKAKGLHKKHENAGPEATESAVHLDQAAKGAAKKIMDGEKPDLAPLKAQHEKLVSKAEEVVKDLDAFVKDHADHADALKRWGGGVDRALSGLTSAFDQVQKASEKGFDSGDSRKVKEMGQEALALAAQIGNAVKEMKRLGET